MLSTQTDTATLNIISGTICVEVLSIYVCARAFLIEDSSILTRELLNRLRGDSLREKIHSNLACPRWLNGPDLVTWLIGIIVSYIDGMRCWSCQSRHYNLEAASIQVEYCWLSPSTNPTSGLYNSTMEIPQTKVLFGILGHVSGSNSYHCPKYYFNYRE